MSKHKDLIDNEYLCQDDATFMPEEFDDAYVGMTATVWEEDKPVYDMELFDGRQFPKTPDDMIEPLIIRTGHLKANRLLEEGYMLFEENPEILESAIIGVCADVNRVVYDYDLLVQAYAEHFVNSYPLEDDDYRQEEDEDDVEYGDRLWEQAISDAIDWVEFNTLRDYSYKEVSPVVVRNMDYLF